MLSIVLLSRNTHALSKRCLSSLQVATAELGREQELEYILVDDCSHPSLGICGLFEQFRASTSAPVRIIRFKVRQHYSRGCAYAFSAARGSEVLFVSHDMVVTPAYIRTVRAVAALDESIGVVRGTSPHVDCHSGYVVPLPAGCHSEAAMNEFAESLAATRGLAYVRDALLIGDSMLIKRSVIDKIGTIDPRYYGFFGDIDFGLRLLRAGFQFVCAGGAWLFHEGQGHTKLFLTGEISRDMVSLLDFPETVMKDYRAAYELFRAKWDPQLPGDAGQFSRDDLARLCSLPPKPFDYQPLLPLDEQICELL
jgi:O-antigen biosynthesis protein